MKNNLFFNIGIGIMLVLLAHTQVLAQADKFEITKITLNVTNEPLGSVLDKISEMTGAKFVFDKGVIDVNRRVTLNVKDKAISEVIRELTFKENPDIKFQDGKRILLTKSLMYARYKIAGKIISARDKTPLPGATIIVTDNNLIGTITDGEGKFVINVPQNSQSMTVSYVGYEDDVVTIRGANDNLIIELTPQLMAVKDVVVTGISKREKSSFTGSYVTVKGAELRRISPNNLLKALQYFDPSFRIVENNARGSDPNSLPDFRMRGDASLGAIPSTNTMQMLLNDYSSRPNMPLFVLDGFEVSLQRIVDLDPERVATMTLLKDASATAIYGSKASNGVIVIETEKPQPGNLQIFYSTNIGIQSPDLSDYNLLNANEKLQLELDAGIYDLFNAEQMNNYNRYKTNILEGVDTYWLSQPLRTAVLHRHSLSIQGGDQAFLYSLGVNYSSSPGVMKKSSRENLGLNLDIQYRKKKWNISNNVSVSNTTGNESPYGSFSAYSSINPYYRPKNENGGIEPILDVKGLGTGIQRQTINNPLYDAQFDNINKNNTFAFSDNLQVEFLAMENLRFNGSMSITKNVARTDQYLSASHSTFVTEPDLTKRGSYNKSLGEGFSFSTNITGNYNFVKNDHVLSVFASWSMEQNDNLSHTLSAKGYPTDAMNDFFFGFEMDDRINGDESRSRSMGLIGTLSYMYKGKYAIDANVRYDASSRFGSESRWAPFWSIGGRWNISRENCFEGSRALSDLSIRATYGVTGSQNFAPYQAIETYSFNELMFPYLSSDVLGAELMGLGNPNLGWSTTNETNVGLDAAFLENRLSLQFSYYHNYTKDLLESFNIAPSIGFETMYENAGAILNTGYELGITATPYRNYQREIMWGVSVMGSHNKSTVKKISSSLKKKNEENLLRKDAPLPIYQEGESQSRIFAVQSLGIDPATGREVFLKRDGTKTFTWNPADKIPMGDTEPKLRGSVSTSFSYRNFSFSFGMTYQFGGEQYNSTLVDKIENSSLALNVDRRAMTERWKQPGDVARYKSIELVGHQTEASSRFLMRDNYFQFGSINLNYRFDSQQFKFLNKLRVSNFSLSATLEELGRISTIKMERGLDYPFARTYNISLSVTFK